MKVYIVQGTHFSVPGQPLTVHETRLGANMRAAGLVNELLRSVELPTDTISSTWEADLLRARNARAKELGVDSANDLIEEDDADVWILVLDVLP